MTHITPSILKLLRTDIDKALEPIVKKYGLSSIKAGNASYSSNSFTIKVEGVLDGNAKSEQDAKMSNYYAGMLGLPKDIVGKRFIQQGTEFEVVLIDPKKPKFPVIAKRSFDGKMFKFPAAVVAVKLK